jgi:MFS superfamily sulfate permease-like transporter
VAGGDDGVVADDDAPAATAPPSDGSGVLGSLYGTLAWHAEVVRTDPDRDAPFVLGHVVVDASPMAHVDATACLGLKELARALARIGVELHFAHVLPAVEARLRRAGVVDAFGGDAAVHATVNAALTAITARLGLAPV